jgi:protein-disulfide isomerase-like protein with CxxC motif
MPKMSGAIITDPRCRWCCGYRAELAHMNAVSGFKGLGREDQVAGYLPCVALQQS